MYQKTTTILPLQMNHTAPTQILQYYNKFQVSFYNFKVIANKLLFAMT